MGGAQAPAEEGEGRAWALGLTMVLLPKILALGGCSHFSGLISMVGARQGLLQLLLFLVRPQALHAAPIGSGPGDQTVLRAPGLPSVWDCHLKKHKVQYKCKCV